MGTPNGGSSKKRKTCESNGFQIIELKNYQNLSQHRARARSIKIVAGKEKGPNNLKTRNGTQDLSAKWNPISNKIDNNRLNLRSTTGKFSANNVTSHWQERIR